MTTNQYNDKTTRVYNDETQYNVPEMPTTATTVRPVKKSAFSGQGKVIALGTVGVVAGVAGAAGISAYTRAPGMNEKSVTFPSVDGDEQAAPAASSASDNAASSAAAGAAGAAGAAAAGSNEASAHDGGAYSSVFGAGPAASADMDASDASDNYHSQSAAIEPPMSLDEVQVAFSPDDSMSFQEAFASARGEVGPHGLFAWRGDLFGTYYEDEWNELPKEYRTEFSNHDWSQHNDLVFVTEEVPVPELPSMQHDEDGRALMALISAVTGEPVTYYPDGAMSPVLDSNGQLIAFVETGILEQAADKSLVITDTEVIVTDHPEQYMALEVTEDYLMTGDVAETAVEYFDPEDGVVTVINADDIDDGEVLVAQVDDDAVVIDFDDYDMAEVDDLGYDVISISEDAINGMPDMASLDTMDDPAADDLSEFDDYTI